MTMMISFPRKFAAASTRKMLAARSTSNILINNGHHQRRFKSAVPSEVSALRSLQTLMAERSEQPSSSSKTPQHVLDQMLYDQRIPNRRGGRPTSKSSPVSEIVAEAAAAAQRRKDKQHSDLVKEWMTQNEKFRHLPAEMKEEEKATAATSTTMEQRTHVTYTDGTVLPLTSQRTLFIPTIVGNVMPNPFPVYRLLEESGQLRKDNVVEDNRLTTMNTTAEEERISSVAKALEENLLLKDNGALFQRAYETMIRLRTFDDIMMNVQRQGRIPFYMSCLGEEAIHIGVASAISDDDVILAQYREQGLLLWRGFDEVQMAHQCFSTHKDLGKGRQMPIHYGSKEHQYHTVSSPLGTQLPQAVGVAYKLKMENNKFSETNKRCAVAFFGEGAASTGDFHTACNMAATLDTPLLLICRNNGYAISTSTSEQYRGDGIVSRSPGYGMAAIRVDGNDLLAIHSTIQMARHYSITNNAPVLIECMTYRQSHHSTSDDSTRYRSKDEVDSWSSSSTDSNGSDPLQRLLNYKKVNSSQDVDVDAEYKEFANQERRKVLQIIHQVERAPKPDLETLFEDVYQTKPFSLIKQERELKEHIEANSDYYYPKEAA